MVTEQFVSLHPGPTSAEVIRDVFALYVKNHSSVLDLTYGKGTFWNWNWPKRWIILTANDLYVTEGIDTAWDFRRLPETTRRWDVVVFDPPFSAMGPSSDGNNNHSERYGAGRHQQGGPQNIRDVMDWTVEGIAEATSVANKLVVVKCQPVVESGRYWDTPHIVKDALLARGWRIDDVVFFASHRRPQPNDRRVVHFRNVVSQFIVAGKVN